MRLRAAVRQFVSKVVQAFLVAALLVGNAIVDLRLAVRSPLGLLWRLRRLWASRPGCLGHPCAEKRGQEIAVADELVTAISRPVCPWIEVTKNAVIGIENAVNAIRLNLYERDGGVRWAFQDQFTHPIFRPRLIRSSH